MHILLTTYGLVLIFALFCAAQWRQAIQMAYLDIAATESFLQVLDDQLDQISDNSKKYYYQLRPKKDKKPTDPTSDEELTEEEEADEAEATQGPDGLNDPVDDEDEGVDSKKGQRISYLRVGALFCEENPSIHEGVGKASYTLLKNLIRELYQNQDFYEEANKEEPDFDQQMLLSMIDKANAQIAKEKTLKSAVELCNLNLEDRLQSLVRYEMFTGTKSRMQGQTYEEAGYYPLSELITFKDGDKLMSIWNAPEPLLMALFENEDVVRDVIRARMDIYNELRKDKNKSSQEAKESELKRRFSTYIQGIDPELIDFKVSRSYPAKTRKPSKKLFNLN